MHLAAAVAAAGKWRVPMRLNETTRAFFTQMAEISPEADAGPLSRAARPDIARGARRRRLLRRTRAGLLVDDAHVDFADDDRGRLPDQRHPVGSEGDARRAHAARREPGSVPRGADAGHQRSGSRRALHQPIPASPARRTSRRASTPRCSGRFRRRWAATTTR